MPGELPGGGIPPVLSRRSALQRGSIGLFGLGATRLLPPQNTVAARSRRKETSVIFVFLSGGISHQDSFDMKPDAPASVRGEFQPISTRTPGIQICEHLPRLAQRGDRYALVRSVGTNSSGHEQACHMLLTGRLDLPPAFSTRQVPSPNEWPAIPSLMTYALPGRHHLPPAVVLPQPSVNELGRVRPGQYAGRLGRKWEAWHIDIAANCPLGNGACPHCFRFEKDTFRHAAKTIFNTPLLNLPTGGRRRLAERVRLLHNVEQRRDDLNRMAAGYVLDRHRQEALSVLADPKTSKAFDVEHADPRLLGQYGKNKFGLSLLMASRLIEAGVRFVQVNLGKNSSWDTHRRNFLNLKRNLLPYFDQSISALLDDLAERGLLESTLVVVTGEFGRTPKINKDAGRDHWGPVMTSLFAGGGVQGGRVIGATDRIAAYPIADKQTPENIAATMYHVLGIPRDAQWTDFDGRPHSLYRGGPISGLM